MTLDGCVSVCILFNFPQLPFQIRKALKEQRDVNLQLRNYIDGILMNIIEQHPELLEVRK